MIKIGITGGMGSGKSTVAKIFEALNIPVFYADLVSKKILETNTIVKQKLTNKFGAKLYSPKGLNRPFLAEQIFNNAENIAFVNGVVHPAVAEAFELWCQKQTSKYCLKEAAILFETGAYKQLDKTILVCADVDLRIERVMAGNSWTKDEVEARLKNQWPDSEKIKLADFVIYNNQKEMLTPQILTIHENIIGQANPTS